MTLGTLQELADRVGGRVIGDGSVPIARISAVDDAGSDTLTFATTQAYFETAAASRAAAVLVDVSLAGARIDKPLLVVDNARHALAQLLEASKPRRPQGPFRHPSAVIESDAELAADVYVDAHAYIGRGATVGLGSVVGAGAFLGDRVSVGESVWIHSHASLMPDTRVGDRVVLHAGCVIGSDGFGWAFVDGRSERIPQVGNVVLEDDVEIGANTCIDRAQTGSTRIGAGTKIDNLVQIGHNCRIGKHCVIAALTGLAGSTVIGDYVKVAGQVGFKGHVTVGSRVTIAGQSGIWSDVADGATVSGNPAHDHRDELRREVMIRRLPKLFDRVDALERSQTGE
ncbi:MAG: UDP-3-O-(3-hydroxymyristoyl)glucosamine N-acyltransferase [Candidatus Eremiobacteraeota bacterium]|nr:UDP-3-O-(3-hydroxymyristoyl)glucosamine N-acyltransferase [Candidatus Eremiobacteraeota bacterium]